MRFVGLLTWEGEAAENLPIWIHVCYSFRRIHLPGDIVYDNVAERVITCGYVVR